MTYTLWSRRVLIDYIPFFREMAGSQVTGATELQQWRLLLLADVLRLPAPGAETAAGRGVQRARHITGQPDPFPPGRVGIRFRHGRQQGMGVRVAGVVVELVAFSDLDDLAEVHDRDPVGDVPDHRQVVRDEQVGEVELV